MCRICIFSFKLYVFKSHDGYHPMYPSGVKIKAVRRGLIMVSLSPLSTILIFHKFGMIMNPRAWFTNAYDRDTHKDHFSTI